MEAANQLDWSDDQIARFWDYWSTRNDTQENYFALQVGRGVTNFASYVGPLESQQVLDFGSGPGHLVSYLLAQGAQVSATDTSPQSVEEAQHRYAGHAGWGEAKTLESGKAPWPDASFDVVFCLETIEHLHSEQCIQVFDEIHRLLRPGGHAVITTPRREDLQRSHVYCPNCNTEFHRWQHLRSWSEAQLQAQLQHQGYNVVFCEGLNFHDFQPSPMRRIRFGAVRRWLRTQVMQRLDRWWPRPFPQQRYLQRLIRKGDRHHLAAVARKPEADASVLRPAA